MVRFKTVKFKHYRKARELTAREKAGEDIEVEYLTFAVLMVEEWDFKDEETGDPLPLDTTSLDELTLEQMEELATLFNRKFAKVSTIPKATAEPSLSTLTPSNQEESRDPSPSG